MCNNFPYIPWETETYIKGHKELLPFKYHINRGIKVPIEETVTSNEP